MAIQQIGAGRGVSNVPVYYVEPPDASGFNFWQAYRAGFRREMTPLAAEKRLRELDAMKPIDRTAAIQAILDRKAEAIEKARTASNNAKGAIDDLRRTAIAARAGLEENRMRETAANQRGFAGLNERLIEQQMEGDQALERAKVMAESRAAGRSAGGANTALTPQDRAELAAALGGPDVTGVAVLPEKRAEALNKILFGDPASPGGGWMQKRNPAEVYQQVSDSMGDLVAAGLVSPEESSALLEGMAFEMPKGAPAQGLPPEPPSDRALAPTRYSTDMGAGVKYESLGYQGETKGATPERYFKAPGVGYDKKFAGKLDEIIGQGGGFADGGPAIDEPTNALIGDLDRQLAALEREHGTVRPSPYGGLEKPLPQLAGLAEAKPEAYDVGRLARPAKAPATPAQPTLRQQALSGQGEDPEADPDQQLVEAERKPPAKKKVP